MIEEIIELNNELEKIMNLLNSVGEERRYITIKALYNRSKYADKNELSIIGRDVIRLFQGGMGSFFNDFVLQDSEGQGFEKENSELEILKNKLFNAALKLIK